ncbi:hypothetical protein SDC9_103751 [bioreactor metagenome]|uniref:Uncharacterized protein n=1 Tax=bioreactor metagenome TaxID=1076179 RepID=A0A645B5C9_9ZZZZ
MDHRLVDHPLLHRFIEPVGIKERAKGWYQMGGESIGLGCGRQPKGVIALVLFFRQPIKEGEYLSVLRTGIVMALIGDEQHRFLVLDLLQQDVCKGVPR